MTLELLEQAFSVCKLSEDSPVDLSMPFCFYARTDAEISIVCETEAAPANCLAREDGWRALRVAGQLDFSLLGILAGLTGALAAAGVSVFAVSTYDGG